MKLNALISIGLLCGMMSLPLSARPSKSAKKPGGTAKTAQKAPVAVPQLPTAAQAAAKNTNGGDYAYTLETVNSGTGERKLWNSLPVVYADEYRIVTIDDTWTEDEGTSLHLWDASTLRYQASVKTFFWPRTWGQEITNTGRPSGDGHKCAMGGSKDVFALTYEAGGMSSIAEYEDEYTVVDALNLKTLRFGKRNLSAGSLKAALSSLRASDLGGMSPQSFRSGAAAMIVPRTPLDCNLFPEVAPMTLSLRAAGRATMQNLNPETLTFVGKPALPENEENAGKAAAELLPRLASLRKTAYMSRRDGSVVCGKGTGEWKPFCESVFTMGGAFDTVYFLMNETGNWFRLTSAKAWQQETFEASDVASPNEIANGKRHLLELDQAVETCGGSLVATSGKQAPTLNHIGKSGDKLFWLISAGEECRLYQLDPGNKKGKLMKKWTGVFNAHTPMDGDTPPSSVEIGKVTMPDVRPLYLPELHLICLPVQETRWHLFRLNEETLETTPVCDAVLRSAHEFAFILPDGRYAGSPGCESFLSFTQNGKTVGMAPFAAWKNRPADVVRALTGNEQAAAILAATTERWLKKLGHGAEDNMPAVESLPAVTFEIPALWSEEKTLTLPLKSSGTTPATAYTVRVNGVEQPKLAAAEAEETTLELKLEVGQNRVEVTPESAEGVQGDTVSFRVLCKGEKAPERYIVCLGVSEYAKVDANLKCAAKDAADIAKVFAEGLGEKTHTLLLQNAQVTHETPAAIAEFLKDARPEDEVILFCAGHGVRDEALTYYFCGNDFEPEHPDQTGISYDRLIGAIEKSAARHRLVLMDTCHAGVVGEEDEEKLAQNGALLPEHAAPLATRGMRVKKAEISDAERAALVETQAAEKRYIESLFNLPGKRQGLNIITAVSGSQLAMEDPESGNGLFTSGILKAMADEKSDINGDGRFSIDELGDILRAAVPEYAVTLLRSACAAQGTDYENVRNTLPEPMTPNMVAYEESQNFALKTFSAKEPQKMQLTPGGTPKALQPAESMQTAATHSSEASSSAADNGAAAQLARVSGLTMRTKLEAAYQKRIIELLEQIAEGAPIDTRLDAARNNTTCLHNAAAICDLELVQWLVGHGADINAKAKNGATPLVCVGDDPVRGPQVRRWLQGVADGSISIDTLGDIPDDEPDSATADNGAAAQLARVSGLTMRTKLETAYQKRIIELLEQIAKGAPIDTRLDAARNNTTCLHNAAAICDFELVQWLVEHGADINAKAKNNARPLDCVGDDKAKAPKVRQWLKANGGKSGL